MTNSCEAHQWMLQTKEGGFGEITKNIAVPQAHLAQVLESINEFPQGAVVLCEKCGSTPDGTEASHNHTFNAEDILSKLAS